MHNRKRETEYNREKKNILYIRNEKNQCIRGKKIVQNNCKKEHKEKDTLIIRNGGNADRGGCVNRSSRRPPGTTSERATTSNLLNRERVYVDTTDKLEKSTVGNLNNRDDVGVVGREDSC